MQQQTTGSARQSDVTASSLAALAVATARTWSVPRWVRRVVAVFVATRLALLLVTYVGFVLIQEPNYSTRSVGLATLLNSWQKWDAAWYLRIAAHGYAAPTWTAFFPLYPLLIAAASAPSHGQAAYVAALVLSNLATLAALLLLYWLAAQRWGESVALRAVMYLAIFPTALFLFAPYNESLFLALSLGCFVALGKRQWALAGALGGLAVLTRSAGLLLLIPFVWAVWQRSRDARVGLRTWLPVLWAMLIPAGLASFAAYCAVRFGDPLAFTHAQADWNRVLAWPWQGIVWQVQGLLSAPAASFFQVHDVLDLAATAGAAALLIPGWRILPRDQWLYMAALVLLIVIEPGGVHLHQNDPLSSNARFVLEMFPAFILLARLTQDRPQWHQSLVVVFTSLLAVLSLVFVLGRWLV